MAVAGVELREQRPPLDERRLSRARRSALEGGAAVIIVPHPTRSTP